VKAYDPEGAKEARKLLNISLCGDAYEAIAGADGVVILTEWNEFRTPNFLKMVTSLKKKVIFDGRNLFDINAIRDLGFYYVSIGRATAVPENNQYHKSNA